MEPEGTLKHLRLSSQLVRCLSLLLLIAGVANTVDDFASERDGLTFIYHDDHDLLLISTNNSCYFILFGDAQEGYLSAGYFRDTTMTKFSEHLLKNDGIVLAPTTLEAMRDKHSDLLADFQCQTKKYLYDTQVDWYHVLHH